MEPQEETLQERGRRQDKALALMVYETWLLNGCRLEAVPSKRLRKWCNRVLHRELDWTAH